MRKGKAGTAQVTFSQSRVGCHGDKWDTWALAQRGSTPRSPQFSKQGVAALWGQSLDPQAAVGGGTEALPLWPHPRGGAVAV